MGYQGDIFAKDQMAKSMSSGSRRGKNQPVSRVPRSQRSQGVKRQVNNGANSDSNLRKNVKNDINNNTFRLPPRNYPLEFVGGLPNYDD